MADAIVQPEVIDDPLIAITFTLSSSSLQYHGLVRSVSIEVANCQHGSIQSVQHSNQTILLIPPTMIISLVLVAQGVQLSLGLAESRGGVHLLCTSRPSHGQ